MARSDALVGAAKLAGHLTRIAVERLRASGDIPASPEAIDTTWLQAALSRRFAGARLLAVSRIGGSAGTTRREHLQLTWAPDPGSPNLPETIFAKLTPAGLGTRLFGSLFALGHNEVSFYREIRPQLSILAPDCYCARSGGPSGRFVLLLEDLRARGARFATLAEPVTLEEARAVVDTLASLHATFWRSPAPKNSTDSWRRGFCTIWAAKSIPPRWSGTICTSSTMKERFAVTP